MNKNYNLRDIYLDNYYSPFPRQKSNREVLNYSQAKKLANNKAIIDIPPSVTLSYMRKIQYISKQRNFPIVYQKEKVVLKQQQINKQKISFQNLKEIFIPKRKM